MSNTKRYFSFFGMLFSTINTKILSVFSSIRTIININTSIIQKILLQKELKPINLYYPCYCGNSIGNTKWTKN